MELDGEMTQGDTPEWQPLVDLVGEELAEWFMWMYEVRTSDGRSLHAYKHRMTRQYLHLDHTGQGYVYTREGRYRTVAAAGQLALLLAQWYERLPEQAPMWREIETLVSAIE